MSLNRDVQIQRVMHRAFTHRLPVSALGIGLFLGLFNGWFALVGIALYAILSIALTLNKRFVQAVVRKDRGW